MQYFNYLYSCLIQFSSVTQLCPTLRPCGLQHTRLSCPSPTPRAFSNSCPLSWWCHPTISSRLQSFPASVFSDVSVLCIRWPKCWSFSFSISPSSEYPGLISFRMDWFDLFAVQRTLKSLLQHHSSKATILQRSAFFMVQLSHPYMTTGKTIALTRQTFVGKVLGFKREHTTLGKNESFISGLCYSFWHIFRCQQVVSE